MAAPDLTALQTLNKSQRAVAIVALRPQVEHALRHGTHAYEGIPGGSGNKNRTRDVLAHLAGVGQASVGEAIWLVAEAETNPEAERLLADVRAGTLSVWTPRHILTGAPPRQRGRPQAATHDPSPPPPFPTPTEAANERAVRVFLQQLAGAQFDMQRQGLTPTYEGMQAWWKSVEPMEWQQVREAILWFAPLWRELRIFLNLKREHVPPMVQALISERIHATEREYALPVIDRTGNTHTGRRAANSGWRKKKGTPDT